MSKQTFTVTIESHTADQITAFNVHDSLITSYPWADVHVYAVTNNADVQHAGQGTPSPRKPNPKVNAAEGIDLSDAIAIASQRPMTASQRRQRDLLLTQARAAGISVEALARMADMTSMQVYNVTKDGV